MSRDPMKARERQRRYRAKRHAEKYGLGAGNMKGRAQHHPSGPDHCRWSEDRMVSAEGYVKVRVGRTHPLADPNGYAYEHLLVWVSAGNPRPPRGFTLHHTDEVKSNNQLTNLELLTRAEHNRRHMAEMSRDGKTGRIIGKRLLDGAQHDARPEVRPWA